MLDKADLPVYYVKQLNIKLKIENSTQEEAFQRAAEGAIAAGGVLWNGLMKAGAKVFSE